MFLKPHRREKKGVVYEYWTLEESVRTAEGPRHRTVATLGKLPGLEEEARVGWEHIGEILDGRSHQLDLLRQEASPPAWARVDTSRLRVERLRKFGEVYLGLALWRRLKLDAFFNAAMKPGREEIAWSTMACILVLARFCAPSSELQIAKLWYGKTSLDELLQVPEAKMNDDRLYRALDALLPHKDGLFRHFQQVYGELFGTVFDILLYDITSTYSEGRIQKEHAIREKQLKRLEAELDDLKASIQGEKRALRNYSTAERRVGRLFQKYSRAARWFDVKITEEDDPKHKSGKRLAISISKNEEYREWTELADGCYLLRTNLQGWDARALWKTYIGLTQIEDAFRATKHDLGLRPLFHQKQDRTQAHILVCFLALVLWRTLQQ